MRTDEGEDGRGKQAGEKLAVRTRAQRGSRPAALALLNARRVSGAGALVHRAYQWLSRDASSAVVIVIALAGFAGDFVLRLALGRSSTVVILLAAPIVVLALRYGLRGGVLGGLGAGLAAVAWATPDADQATVQALSRTAAYVGIGALVGWCVDERNFMERRLRRHHDLSLDLFAVVAPDGTLYDLNPAWERVLGHSRETIATTHLTDLVHPDDREATHAVLRRLFEAGMELRGYRNRYRCADGTYRWLEWWATAMPQDGYVYATARDVTLQKQAEDALSSENQLLARTVVTRTEDLQRSRLDTLQRLAVLAEYRDQDTFQHTERVGRNSAVLARAMGLSEAAVALLRHAAPLHDIGKVAIPDAVLRKPGALTSEELAVMQRHVEVGAEILADEDFPLFVLASLIARTHHERWDGTGYSRGLAGLEIPLAGRIVAVADAFDAMTHDRPYRRALGPATALAELERLVGSQFDPSIVATWATLDVERLLLESADYDVEVSPALLTEPIPAELVAGGRRPAGQPRGLSRGGSAREPRPEPRHVSSPSAPTPWPPARPPRGRARGPGTA